MAVARAMSLAERNPLRCGGTELPVGLLAMAKVMAICMALSLPPVLLPRPFLPFLPVFDWMEAAAPGAIVWTLRAAATAATAALLFNIRVRAAAFALGAAHLLAVLGNRSYYSNTTTFTACMLILAGLYHPRFGARLPAVQVALLYFGAALHKALDPDWRSGLFFDHWLGTDTGNPFYARAAEALPPMWPALALSWGTIALEFALAGLFLGRRGRAAAIWTSVLFHCAITVLTGARFLFFYPIQAAMLAMVEWPKRMLVIYDGDCGICGRVRRAWERIDFDGLFTWTPLQSGAGDHFNIPKERLMESLHFIAGEKVTRGFRACKRMLQYHPATWLVLAGVLAMPVLSESALYRAVVILGALAFFLPVTEPVGEMVYRWVANNRYRLSTGGACAVDPEAAPAGSPAGKASERV